MKRIFHTYPDYKTIGLKLGKFGFTISISTDGDLWYLNGENNRHYHIFSIQYVKNKTLEVSVFSLIILWIKFGFIIF